MKKLIFSLLLYILFLASQQFANAQTPRFNAGLVAGLNFSELEGEEITDYFGLNIGVIGIARLSKHWQMGVEMLFSQNGEYILPEYYPRLQYGTVRLNHIEIPVHIDLLIGVFERDKFYDCNINLGIAYTRLLGYYAEDRNKTNVTDQVLYKSKEALLLQAGTTYHFSKHFGLNLKTSLPIRIDGLSWSLAARLVYMI